MTFDFRNRFGLSVDEIGESIPWREAIDLVDGLTNQDGTHTQAAVVGWRWPMTRADIDLRSLRLLTMNIYRNEKEHPAPYELPWPWDPAPFTPAEVAEATVQLELKSAFHTREAGPDGDD